MFLPFSLILSKSSSKSIIGSAHSFHSTSFNDQCLFNACLVSFKPITIILGHWLRIQASIDSFPSSQLRLVKLQLITSDCRFHWWKASVADTHPFHIRISTFPYNSSPFLPTTYCNEDKVWVALVVSFIFHSKLLNK